MRYVLVGPLQKDFLHDIPICYLSIRLIRVCGIRLDRVSLLLGHAESFQVVRVSSLR